ncbi:MAG TPA: hypothetical protein VE959_00245 [Bryobacteraceae bacterium]|nr:hypothetical protein [Bryobacteraceae bacterium]
MLVAVLAAFGASNLSAAVVPCPASATLDVLISSFNSLANACSSQDKIYWGFSYTGLGPNASLPTAVQGSLIFQQLLGVAIHGWNFGSNWSQSGVGGALANFNLSFSIEVCPSGDPCFGAVTPGVMITQADAVYAPSSVFMPGPETVTWSNGASVTLTSGSPGPLPPGGNIGLGLGTLGPITVTDSFSGTGDITQTTDRFYETLGPEPATSCSVAWG